MNLTILKTQQQHWRWNWESMCGAGGLNVWIPERHDLGLCFQQVFLQIPVLSLLACLSAYYIGRQIDFVSRGKLQLYSINLRALTVFLLALISILQVYISLYKTDSRIPIATYFLCAVQTITWFAHFGFAMVLRKRLGLSPRGPVFICVIWTLLFVLSVISARSFWILAHKEHFSSNISIQSGFSIAILVLHVIYGLTLIPGEGSTIYLSFSDRYTQVGETQPLLSNAYIRFREEGDPYYLGEAMEQATWFSKLFFYWVNPLMEKGLQKQLNSPDDLYDLPLSINCGIISANLDKALIQLYVRDLHRIQAIEERPPSPNRVTLIRALHKCFWLPFYSIGLLKFISDCTGFAGPLLLNRLVTFIEDQSEDMKWGYLYAGALMLTSLIGAICDTHFNFLISVVGLKMRAAMVSTIYKKTLKVNEATLKSKFSVGEIVNLMSTDTDRIVNACPSFHSFWSIPLQLGVTLYLLYSQVGISFIAGVLFSIILIPINKLIANKIGKLSTELMKQKDARIKMVTEVLRGIKAIKLYVWEQHFLRVITKLRDKELKYLKGRKYLDALCVYFWATTPVLISIFTFGTYVLLGNKLTAATVFTGIALLNMLISPLNAFPWVLNGLTEAWVSIKRMQRLLDLDDLDLERYYNQTLLNTKDDVIIRGANFHWGRKIKSDEKRLLHAGRKKSIFNKKGKGKRVLIKTPDQEVDSDDEFFNLKDIDLRIKKGSFVGIIGTVGAGKSSLLSAISAEMFLNEGEIVVTTIESGFGYVQQQPWLQRGTVRDNILFGKPYDETRYKSVLYACGLADDVLILPNGDLSGVGDSGTTLSGGQRARIALARAVYQDKSVYLLDDILSAVDPNIAKHIFKCCIMELLKNKTRILCTHHVNYLTHCDEIILLEDGIVKKQGKPADVLTHIDDLLPIDLELGESYPSTPSSLLDSIKLENSGTDGDNDSILLEEISETGGVDVKVFRVYWKGIGYALSFFIMFSIAMMQTSKNITDWWLSYWVTNSASGKSNFTLYFDDDDQPPTQYFYSESEPSFLLDDENSTGFYMKIYIFLVSLNTIFTLLRAFLFAYGGLVAASRIHKMLLKSVIKAKSTFFDVTPVGRILNRFSSDTYTIDDSLPFILNILLAQLFSLLGIVIVTIYGMPWVCLVLVPLVPLYHWLQYNYRMTSRELKRLSSVTLSPIYSHFNESLQGLTTIRAMRASNRFKRDNEDYVDANLKAQFAAQAAARWLGIRLQLIGVAMIGGVSFIAVLQHQYEGADPGLVGLAMSYALSVTSALSGVVNAFTETEKEMISVERVNQYIRELPTEAPYFIMDPPFGWPSQGVVSFQNVVLKYREHLPPSLRLVSFETRPSEKIGVVGRTGAGKSSLIAALFRLVEIYSGVISIDSVNISRISLQSLRSRLFCIPQEPFLFSGSLRENLDPLNEFRDNEIWEALDKVNLSDVVRRIGGLEIVLGENVNFSVGQKQLVCLARAILHSAKVLCIDEATANVDRDTDRQIQVTLRSAFRKCTVITIAHRVQTILDCDRVLVMHEGQVAEFDSPDVLLGDSSSLFYQLVNQDQDNM